MTHFFCVNGHLGNHRRHDAKACKQGVNRIEHLFLVFRKVGVVGQGQALHDREHSHKVAVNAACLTADLFGDIRVFLLRHDGRARAEVVGQFDELEVLRGEGDEFFRQAAQVHVAHCGAGIEFNHMVAVTYGIDGIFRRTVKTQGLSGEFAIDREVGAGQSGGAQGAAAHAGVKIVKAREVAFEHPEIGHHPMRKEDGLAGLHMGIARHDHVEMFFGDIYEFFLKVTDGALDFTDGGAKHHFGGNGRLVVAGTGGVKAAAGGTDNFSHALFDGHVNVFVGGTEFKLAVADFLSHLIQALADCFGIFLADDALAAEHCGVRLRTLDIEGTIALFDENRGVEIFDQLICRQIKATTSRFTIHF